MTMKKLIAGLIVAGVAGVFGPAALAADDGPTRLIIGLDLSASNPLVTDNTYAYKAAKRVGSQIGDLQYRSELSLRSFGAYDADANPLTIDVVASVHDEPKALENDLSQFISSIPLLVQQGKLQTQPMTNIIAFMEELSLTLDCKEMPTTIILVTDGVEDSEYVRLIHRNAELPLPEKKIFYRCAELQILGLGRGINSPSETKRLRDEWAKWAKAAGFKNFVGLNDW